MNATANVKMIARAAVAALALLAAALCPTAAMGQTTQPAAGGQIAPPPSLSAQLGTVSGVIVATLAAVQVLKRLLRDVPAAGRVPTWCYAVGVAAALTLAARYAIGCLAGELTDLLWQACIGAAAASGLFSWLKEPGDAPADAGGRLRTPWGLLLAVMLTAAAGGAGGCQLSDGQKYLVASETYTAAATSIASLSRAGMIPLADLERVRVVSDEADAVLDRMRDAVLAGERLTAQWHYAQLQALIDELIRLELRAKARAATPAGKAVSDGRNRGSTGGPERGPGGGAGADAADRRGPGGRAGADDGGDRRGDVAAETGEGRPGCGDRTAAGTAGGAAAGVSADDQRRLVNRLLAAGAEVEWD